MIRPILGALALAIVGAASTPPASANAEASPHEEPVPMDHSGLCSFQELKSGCTTKLLIGGGSKCSCPKLTTPAPS
jgi:hypothetical protein